MTTMNTTTDAAPAPGICPACLRRGAVRTRLGGWRRALRCALCGHEDVIFMPPPLPAGSIGRDAGFREALGRLCEIEAEGEHLSETERPAEYAAWEERQARAWRAVIACADAWARRPARRRGA